MRSRVSSFKRPKFSNLRIVGGLYGLLIFRGPKLLEVRKN